MLLVTDALARCVLFRCTLDVGSDNGGNLHLSALPDDFVEAFDSVDKLLEVDVALLSDPYVVGGGDTALDEFWGCTRCKWSSSF